MKTHTKTPIAVALSCLLSGSLISTQIKAKTINEALMEGKANVDTMLRFESAKQDNALEDASALTLRTRIGYTSGSVNGFSAKIEVEDSRIVAGEGDYTVGPTGYNLGIYSVIADPEVTELDQAYVQYKTDKFLGRLGRQVITFDNHRFVGHVGWRQDRQTFDGLTAKYDFDKDVSATYAYIDKRNRIFGEEADLDSKDHLLNVSYNTSVGKLVGYAYLLELDNGTSNALDTYGLRFTGATKGEGTKFLYTAEYATQSSETATTDFDADYLNLEAGAVISGVTVKLGYELLGSDNGAFGFSTPLATLHAFNGWADIFLGTPAQGLVDTTVTLSGKLWGGKWTAIYHDFEADDASDTVDDLGSEVDLLYVRKLAKNITFGAKYAAYNGESGRVDTDKIWLWVGAKF